MTNDRYILYKFPLWMKLLKVLYTSTRPKHCITSLAKEINMTYSHCHKLTKDMEKEGYLILSKQHVNYNIKLSETGTKKAEIISKL